MSLRDMVPVVASTDKLFKALISKASSQKAEISRRRELKDSFKSQFDQQRKGFQGEIDDLKKKEEELKESLKSSQYDEEKIKLLLRRHGRMRGKDVEDLREIYDDMVNMIIQRKFKDYLRSLLQVDEKTETAPATSLDAKEKYKIYGLLISACKVKTIEPIGIGEEHGDEDVADTTEVEDEGNATALAKHEEKAYNDNIKEARRLTFDMLKLLPPLVVCQPIAYNEHLQDTNRMTWNVEFEEGSYAPLHYYRPVLVYGNHLHVAVKGLVGNTGKISAPSMSKSPIDVAVKGSVEKSWVIQRDSIILKKELDSGAYGKVCVAMYQNTEVAAKRLHEIILSDYNMSVFLRELEISSRLRHPNIVRFIGATRDEHPIILAELMSTSLDKKMQHNPLTTSQVTKVSLDVCAALDYLHHFKPDPILHRDVSSPNVLLNISSTGHWVAKLSDLGSANFVNQVSKKSVYPGNASYAAPESRHPEEHSPAMDVYSFGVLLMEMSLHDIPVETNSRNRIIKAKNITTPLFKAIVQQCLKEKKKERPQISEVTKALQFPID